MEMYKLLVSLIVPALVLLSEADICSHLPGYTVYGSSCFKYYTSEVNWTVGEASCVADGGHLASIHSSEEHDFLVDLVAGSNGPWIGLTGTRYNMAWSDGTDVDYTNWYGSNPDRNGVNCVRLSYWNAYLWGDIACDVKRVYMCRIDKTLKKTFFSKVPGGVPVNATVVPLYTQEVSSMTQCARSCAEDVQCVHFIMSEDGGKYLCETYNSLYRPATATPPTDNYKKVVQVSTDAF